MSDSPLTRADLASMTLLGVVDPGGKTKASVSVFEGESGKVVVKDLEPMSRWVRRLYGQWFSKREVHFLRRLEDVGGIPQFRGRLDGSAFAMEHIEGVHFNRTMSPEFLGEVLDSLERTIAEMHSHFVVHLDLHEKKNILIDSQAQVHLIDFETALDLTRLGWFRRPARWLLAPLDRSALVKFKGRFAPHLLSAKEAKRYAQSDWRRRLWFPKRIGSAVKRWIQRRTSTERPTQKI